MVHIRERARLHLAQVPPNPGEVRSIGPTGPLYTKLSGITQNMLEESWKKDKPPGLTSCNSFVAIYAGAIGIAQQNRSLGQFGLDKKLAQWNKSFAWVPATPGVRPKYGDIFELATRLHQGVSLDLDGSTWNTAEGGQGGRKTGHDIIKRKQIMQTGDTVAHTNGDRLKGWVDIELFAGGPPKTPAAMPDWLLGWWEIPWRGRFFYYLFETDFKASWTFSKPISAALVPAWFNDMAAVTVDGPQSVTLKWSATGSVESFTQTGAGHMIGKWNATEPLIATKLF